MTISFTQYVRDRKNRRRGIFVVDMNKSQVNIGWSLCSTTKGDEFNREFGKKIAKERREKKERLNFTLDNELGILTARNEVPHSMRPVFDKVINRCKKINNKVELATK